MRKKKRVPVVFLAIFVLAIVLSFIAVTILPIPEELKKTVFFLAVPAISGVCVTVCSHLMKK